jgi:hypothetical protein
MPPRKTVPPKDEIRRVSTLALLDVASDQTAPSAARAAAARTLLESLGDIGRLQELARAAERPLSELSLAELDAEIQKAQSRPAAS